MSASYVCTACRHRLIRRATQLSQPQWHSKRPFLSFANPGPPPPSNDPQKANDDSAAVNTSTPPKPPPDASSEKKTNEQKPFELLFPGLFAGLPAGEKTGRGRYSKRLSEESGAVEEDNVAESDTASSAPVRHVFAAVDTATYLNKLLDRPASRPSDAWSYFLENFYKDCPTLMTPSLKDVDVLADGKVFRKQLKALIREWCSNPQSGRCPSPLEIVRKYQEAGIMRNDFWVDTIWPLVTQPLKVSATDNGLEGRGIVLSQLMEVWRQFFIQFNPKDPAMVSTGWLCLPHSSHMDRVTVGGHLTRAFEERVDKFVPKYDMTRVVCLPILITFLFFTQDRHNGGITQNLRNEALPFVRLVAHLVPGADMDPLIREIKHLKDRNRLPEESADQLLQDINSLSSQALKMIGAKRFATAMPAAKDDPQLAQEMQDFLTKRLARGFERQDTGIVNRLWEEARSVFAQPGSKAKFVIPSKIYNQLVSGFMQIKRADLAMSAWNEMVSNGTTPTVVTWTAMIAGCQKGRDLNGLEQIWARMIASGVQPDHAAWGARIYGLISLGQRDKGLAALSEMGKAWKESQTASEPIASKGKSRAKAAAKLSLKSVDHPKPNIEIINGALLALSKAPMRFDRKWDTMELVLRWAESYAIKAGNITYNVLLRLALEEQDTTRVSKILRSMEKDNIEPDIATYTIFMNTALRTSLIELPEAEQTKVVIDFLEDMESRGLKPNSVVYSNLIDRLLKEHNNFVAARSVLDHMARRAIVPSAQIYTSLITHYFALEPPAIDAVDSLWQTIMNTPGSITDRFLFDRLIEGYARCDEIGKMMTVLTRMSKEGKSPSWSALIQVVSALSRAGDFQRVRRVVADVENREGLAKVTLSNRGHWAENHFWELVNQLEIPRGQKDVASSAQ